MQRTRFAVRLHEAKRDLIAFGPKIAFGFISS